MPELPDVEVFKRYMDSTALHKRIASVRVGNGRLLDVPARRVRRALEGSAFRSTRRHGKYLFVRLEDDGWLVLHFGMTGALHYHRGADDAGVDPHDRLVVDFDNGDRLGYRNSRRLGMIGLADDVEEFVHAHELGTDAAALTRRGLEDVLSANGRLKSRLMDQSRIAGLGNVYVDEILFQARLHPETPLPLEKRDRERLLRTMNRVLTMAIERGADAERFPRTWLTPHREKGARCPRCGTRLERTRAAGRTTFLCPRRQQKR